VELNETPVHTNQSSVEGFRVIPECGVYDKPDGGDNA